MNRLPSVRTLAERNALAAQHYPLIDFILRGLWHDPAVRRFYHECQSVAHIALLRAAELWRPERGKFSTYAVFCLRKRVGGAAAKLMRQRARRRERRLGQLPAPAPVQHATISGLDYALTQLTARQREVVILRFNLDAGGERTLKEIGDRHGVVQESVRQIEERALQRLAQLVEPCEANRGM